VLKLTLKKGPRVVQSFEFADQERILIGRNEDCDVQVESSMASRHHCEILIDDGFYRLVDMGSSHGTFVNGRRVTEHGLNPGDDVTVGEFSLAYSVEFPDRELPGKPVARKGVGATIEIDGDKLEGHGGPAVAKVRGYLTLVDEQRSRNPILKTATTVVGRVENADVRIDGWWSPRIAALILRERFTFRILDTSRRGRCLCINGKPTREAELKSGDEIRIRNMVMRFHRGLPGIGDDGETVERRDQLR
jgi:predicted component of type VI protein secretion system